MAPEAAKAFQICYTASLVRGDDVLDTCSAQARLALHYIRASSSLRHIDAPSCVTVGPSPSASLRHRCGARMQRNLPMTGAFFTAPALQTHLPDCVAYVPCAATEGLLRVQCSLLQVKDMRTSLSALGVDPLA